MNGDSDSFDPTDPTGEAAAGTMVGAHGVPQPASSYARIQKLGAPDLSSQAGDDFSDVEIAEQAPSETYEGYGTTFADRDDILHYRAAIANGASEEDALKVGDNGIGSADLGTINTTDVYGVAVPRWQLIKMFGPDPAAWRTARATVQLGDRTAVVPIVDEGPGATAQARGVVTDLTSQLAKYLGSNGYDAVKVSYQANAGPDYLTDRDAWFAEQAKFGELGGFSDVEEGAKGEDFSDVEVKEQPKNDFSDAEVATPGAKEVPRRTKPTLSPYAKPGPYKTNLSSDQEQQFQKWVKDNKVPFENDTDTSDYDMRGFWKALQSGDPRAKQALSKFDNRMHFPDVWKTPYHKTFSNESIYATSDAPHWEGDKLVDKSGKLVTDETPKEAPVVAKSAGNWLTDEMGKIWATANLGLSSAKYGTAVQAAKTAEIPDPMYEQEIAAIQASPYYSQAEKDQRIATLRGNQAQERANEAAKLPQAKEDLVKAREEYQKAQPGTGEQIIGSLYEYGAGALMGPLGPIQIAAQASGSKYGELIDGATQRYKELHPEASDEEAFVHANKAVSEAARGAALAQLALSAGFIDLPVAGPLLSRIAGKVGVGAATLEVTNTLAEVQGDLALKKEIDPKQKIGERLKDLDFHLSNLFGGALFALPHAVMGEIGKGEPGVVTVGEPAKRTIISNRQVIYPPNILKDNSGQPNDKQPEAQTVEENGERTAESSGTGEPDKGSTTAPEKEPAKEAKVEPEPKPGREAEGAKTDLEEPARHKVRTDIEPEREGDTGKAGKRRKDSLYNRRDSLRWESLYTWQREKVVRETRGQLQTLYDKKFSPIFKALGIDLVQDDTYSQAAAAFLPTTFKIIVNPLKLAQEHYGIWQRGGLHWRRTELIEKSFQEELMHGAYFKYLRDQARRTGESVRDTIDKYSDGIINELYRAAKAAHNNGDTAGAEVLGKAIEHSRKLYFSGRAGYLTNEHAVAELVRQLMQIRARGRMTEAWYRPLWDKVRRDIIRPAIRTLRSLVGMVNERDLPTLYEVIEGAERNYRMLEPEPGADIRAPSPPREVEESGEVDPNTGAINLPGEQFILPLREVVEKQPHTEELIKAWDEFRDKQSTLHGMWSQLNKILKTLKKYDKNFSRDVDGIGKQLDKNPTVPPVIPTGIRQWLNAANNGLYRHIGQRMKAGGFETVMPDSMIRKWIGAPDDVIPFPRRLREDVKKVLQGVIRDPRTGRLTEPAQDLYDEGVREGYFTTEKDLEDWAGKYNQAYPEQGKKPRITNLERARVSEFPKFFYTYSPEAMLDSIFWQSTEIARLESFGQKISGFKLDKDGNRIAYAKEDLFDKTIRQIQGDLTIDLDRKRHAISAIESLRAIAYGQGWRGALTRTIRGLSSFGMAGSPHTSAKIWTSMFFNLPQYRGIGRTLQGIWTHFLGGQHHADVLELQRLGLKQDVPINIYDDPYTTKNAQQRAQDLFTRGLQVAGHALAQDNAKAVTARVSRMWIMDAIERLREDPTLTKSKTRLIAQDIERRGLDPMVFAQEHIDPKIIDRFVREDVNDIQTAYRPEDYPAWAYSPGGSILFQFGHWAYNSARTITRDIVMPMAQAYSKGDAMLGTRYLGRMMGMFMVAAGAEETWRWIDEHFFGRQSHVATLAEVITAMNKHDGGTALYMLTNRLQQDIIGSPVIGAYGDIAQFIIGLGHGQVDTTHFFDPRTPAAVAYLNSFVNVINQAMRQGGKLSAQQITGFASQMAEIVKGYYDIVEPKLGFFGIGLPGHSEAAGHREASWVRSRQDLFYGATGYPDHRITVKGGGGPHTVYLQNLNEALISGNVARAIDVKRKYQREMKLDDKTLNESLRASVNAHRPIPGGAVGKAFMKWALRDLPKDEIARMRHIDQVFRSTAQRAGIPISAGADQ